MSVFSGVCVGLLGSLGVLALFESTKRNLEKLIKLPSKPIKPRTVFEYRLMNMNYIQLQGTLELNMYREDLPENVAFKLDQVLHELEFRASSK